MDAETSCCSMLTNCSTEVWAWRTTWSIGTISTVTQLRDERLNWYGRRLLLLVLLITTLFRDDCANVQCPPRPTTSLTNAANALRTTLCAQLTTSSYEHIGTYRVGQNVGCYRSHRLIHLIFLACKVKKNWWQAREQDRGQWQRTVEAAMLHDGACSWWWWWVSK